MNPETYDPIESERLRRLGCARPPADVEARIVRGALARMERKGSRRWAPVLWAATATAMVAVVFFFARPGAVDGPVVASIGTGSQLTASAETTTFALAGHEVAVAPEGRVEVTRLEGRAADLRLERGEATFEVQPLTGGERFRVVTGRAHVEVVGTRFTVRDDGACTTVSVERGKVRAGGEGAAERLLGAGESARFCTAVVPGGHPALAALPGEASVLEAIRLLAENRELERAAKLLGSYRTEHPDGVFQEEALYNLCRIEAQLGHTAAAAHLADEFVERFPASARAGRIRQWCNQGR